ncbi:MAG: 2-amino-4-hydroxy-6-hydroxymethyldihydropteridine diphosphokinase [Acidobacteria bacterium]|nr:2-amino-4-hydroxy-6-hydroxymethyldihydropteridine diphosphokinase [Acidobacteriota bacterium]
MSPARRRRVAIALGSNLGDRHAALEFAIDRLRALLPDLRLSSIIETAPEGVPDEQGAFLNAVAVGSTSLDPRALLDALLDIERAFGRTRPYRYAARTLDLDLILYGDVVRNEAGLDVPHPRFRERRFVLAPLAEVAGEWVDPVTGSTISALLRRLPRPSA